MNDEIKFEIRFQEDEDKKSPGRLVGTLLTYEKRASDRAEVFKQGALTWPSGGIVINEQHERAAAIVRAVPELRGDEIIIDAALPDTQRGRDAAVNIRSGLYRGLSVEFLSLKEGLVGGVREIQSARLVRAGLVDDPAYSSSKVEVRNETAPRRRYWL